MSLPETIWWCERHGHGFYVIAGADPPPDHPGVELRVTGLVELVMLPSMEEETQ